MLLMPSPFPSTVPLDGRLKDFYLGFEISSSDKIFSQFRASGMMRNAHLPLISALTRHLST